MKRIGIIDIGSMTARLVIFELLSDSTFKIIEDIKENIALGERIRREKLIGRSKIELILHTIYLYKELSHRYEVEDINCYLSSAYTGCSDLEELIARGAEETGIEIRLLSQKEEVDASFTGAVNNLGLNDGVLLDMGGTTTKIIWFEKRRIKKWESLPMGAASLGEIANIRDIIGNKEEKRLREHVKSRITSVEWLKDVGDLPLIGVGGSMRNLAKIHANMCEYPLNLLHNYHLKEGDVEVIYNRIKTKGYEEKLKVKGLAVSRAPIFTGALFVMEEVLNFSGIESLIISGNGMREGMVYSNYLKVFKSTEEIFENSLLEIMNKFSLSVEEGEKTYRVFKKIYDKIQTVNKINIRDEKILKTACYLGRAGVNINFYDHPFHSLYMILNSGLRGMSHRDLVTAALIVSQQNKFNDLHKNFEDLLGKKDLNCIKKLSIILRVSKLLNKNFLVDKDEFRIEVRDKQVIFSVEKKNLLDIQISRMLMSNDRFKELFNRELVVCGI
ncbi:exopolyphosphatase [Propionigenium maris DSM 9537]|uniref:Exopolyphosphatase n=1 Tax=Propionigenium maris DSM 9537 TaxID=1123000 RepID=A0A9W6GP17_9FUSO|nr:Ppx/GppA phosphatase family protein [Propionigenium maris]GLI57246.1 exopolyphosphatase [Propionigenium maris DSM 9537]